MKPTPDPTARRRAKTTPSAAPDASGKPQAPSTPRVSKTLTLPTTPQKTGPVAAGARADSRVGDGERKVYGEDEGIRLSKTVAALANCSRSEAERYIEGGFVRVDGVVVATPQFRVRHETVTLADNAALTELPSITLIYHKPAGKAFGADNQSSIPSAVGREISAENRTADDASGITLLPRHLTRLTVPCPVETSMAGLVVLTQDGRIARKLIEDAKTLEQEIIVEVKEEQSALPANGLRKLGNGLSFQGKPLPPCKVSWQSEKRLRFAIKGPRPGQIVDMCQQVGLTVVSMKRIRIGRLPMAGLAVGQWRFLLDGERF